ncbi:MAG: nucleoside deaminase [Holosporales bacterium]|jgi:tRNA(adenine34) deaminase|nr:nucleoside deaminase [Holosporales bacterium]
MYHNNIMEKVISEAERYCGPDVPVSAAIAIEDRLISLAINEVELTNIPWNHAEFIAIQHVLKTFGIKYLEKASMYVTLEPCAFCTSVLERVRIKEIFFGAYDPKCGAIFHNAQIFETSLVKPSVIGGIQEARCSVILKKFFKAIRFV